MNMVKKGKMLSTLIYYGVAIFGILGLFTLITSPGFGLAMSNLTSWLLVAAALTWTSMHLFKLEIIKGVQPDALVTYGIFALLGGIGLYGLFTTQQTSWMSMAVLSTLFLSISALALGVSKLFKYDLVEEVSFF
jgi:uncharacterized membrane protein YuzA (DUF378 family)